jgi:co-chaperonin GroES (HSP10)
MLNQLQQIFPNWLVIKPHKLEKIGGLWIPQSANLDFENFTGTIVKMCTELRYEEGNANSMPWDVDLELKHGDTVWYNPLCNHEARPRSETNRFGKGQGFEENGQFYMFVHYQDIFIAKRGDEIICPNGYILGEPVDDTKKYSIILINQPENFKNRCIIRHTGKPVKEYMFGKEVAVAPDDTTIQDGDEVLLMPFGGISLDENRKEIDGGKSFYRFRRRDILAKIVDGVLLPVSDRIFVKEDCGEKVTKAGIILLPDAELRKDGRWGTVECFGGLCRSTTEGQRIYYNHSDSIEIEFNGVKLKAIRERDVLLDKETL